VTKALYPIGLLAVAVVVAGCGREAHRVPDVTGERLDVAQERLEARGLAYETLGGGKLGVVVRSHWVVCEQEPRAGAVAKTVRLVVERSCPEPRPTPGIVPNVTGERLDVAQDRLEQLGFRFEAYATETVLNDPVPIVVPRNWTVCSQYPAGGEVGEAVELYVEHDCFDEE